MEDLEEKDLWVSLGDQVDLEGLKSAHRISSMDLARSEKEFEGLDELDPVVSAAMANHQNCDDNGSSSGEDPNSAEVRPLGKRCAGTVSFFEHLCCMLLPIAVPAAATTVFCLLANSRFVRCIARILYPSFFPRWLKTKKKYVPIGKMTSLELREHAKPLDSELSHSSSLGANIWANVALATAQAFQRFWQRQEKLDAAYDARCQKPTLMPTSAVAGDGSAVASAPVAVAGADTGNGEEGSGRHSMALCSSADASGESVVKSASFGGEVNTTSSSSSSSTMEGAESVSAEMASHAAAEMEDAGLKAELTALAQAQEYDDLNPTGKLLVREIKTKVVKVVLSYSSCFVRSHCQSCRAALSLLFYLILYLVSSRFIDSCLLMVLHGGMCKQVLHTLLEAAMQHGDGCGALLAKQHEARMALEMAYANEDRDERRVSAGSLDWLQVLIC